MNNIYTRAIKTQYLANILVVDDNQTNIAVAVGMLEMFGCSVDSCLDGRDAVETIKQKYYDLIFMDLQMPGLDGFETADQMFKYFDIARIETPIIALTANISCSEDVKKCLNHGMKDVLIKPLTPLMLESRLEAWKIKKIYHHLDNDPTLKRAGIF